VEQRARRDVLIVVVLSARRPKVPAVAHLQPNKATEYRRQVEKIRTIARQLSLNEIRNQLLDSAQHLEVLAEDEKRKAQQVAPIRGLNQKREY